MLNRILAHMIGQFALKVSTPGVLDSISISSLGVLQLFKKDKCVSGFLLKILSWWLYKNHARGGLGQEWPS